MDDAYDSLLAHVESHCLKYERNRERYEKMNRDGIYEKWVAWRKWIVRQGPEDRGSKNHDRPT